MLLTITFGVWQAGKHVRMAMILSIHKTFGLLGFCDTRQGVERLNWIFGSEFFAILGLGWFLRLFFDCKGPVTSMG